jgi:hypothetical protein
LSLRLVVSETTSRPVVDVSHVSSP